MSAPVFKEKTCCMRPVRLCQATSTRMSIMYHPGRNIFRTSAALGESQFTSASNRWRSILQKDVLHIQSGRQTDSQVDRAPFYYRCAGEKPPTKQSSQSCFISPNPILTNLTS